MKSGTESGSEILAQHSFMGTHNGNIFSIFKRLIYLHMPGEHRGPRYCSILVDVVLRIEPGTSEASSILCYAVLALY